jgi:hypothetical protein
MPGAGDIRAGKAFVELYLEQSRLTKGLAGVGKELSAFGAGVSAIGTKFLAVGAAIVAPLLAAAKTFATVGSELNDMSARTGVSTNALSELGYAAQQSGASLADVETGVRRMQKAISAATEGPLASLKGMAPEAQFMAIAESLAAIQDPTSRAAAAMEVFGKSGTSLLPMVGDIKALRAEAVSLGLSMGPEQAAAADALGDAWDKAKSAFRAVGLTIGSALAPMLTGVADWISQAAEKARLWISENKPLIVTIFQVGVAVLGLGGGLLVLGKTISLTGAIFSGAATLIGAFGHVLGIVVTALGFIVSPIGLVVAGLAGLAAYFLYASGTAGKAMDWLIGTFKDLLASAQDTFGAIADALSAGDIGAAVKVLWAVVDLEWQKGVNVIMGIWDIFRAAYQDSVSGIALFFVNLSAQVQTIWADLIAWLDKKFTAWTNTLMQNRAFATFLSKAASLAGAEQSPESIMALGRMLEAQRPAERIDAAAAEQRAAIERNRAAAAEAIGGDVLARQKARAAQEAAREADLADKRAALADAKQEARAAGARHQAEMEKERKPALEPGDLAGMIGGAKISGTFSGAVAAQMGGAGGFQLLARKMDRFIFVGETTTRHLADIKAKLAVGN